MNNALHFFLALFFILQLNQKKKKKGSTYWPSKFLATQGKQTILYKKVQNQDSLYFCLYIKKS